MSKKVVIVSTSLRRNSNSDALAEEFAKGAREAGHSVEKLTLAGKKLEFCRGCLSCQTTHRCVIHDDAAELWEKMVQADALVFATPVYYYEMSGQMKTLLDRGNPVFGTDPAFRSIYLLASAADENPTAMDGAVHGLGGWLDCFPGTRLKGVVRATGVNGPGEVAGSPVLRQAYEMGKSV